MFKFIKEEFRGGWIFRPSQPIDLSILLKLNYSSWYNKALKPLDIRIETFPETNEPTEQQIHTLQFIIDNQSRILDAIYRSYQNIILPVYQHAIDIEFIANDVSDLPKIFGLTDIEIPSFDFKEAVFLLDFNFNYDHEHGIYLLFQNNHTLDFFEHGGKNYDMIALVEKGLHNKDKTPIKFTISDLTNQEFINGEYFFDQVVEKNLPKGPYRMFTSVDRMEFTRNFYVPHDLEKFTLKDILSQHYNS